MIRRFFAMTLKELSLAVASPSAWVFLVIFLVLSSFCAFVASGIFASGQADLALFFDWMPWLFLLIVPALAMPMWSEERRLGVFELTVSFPASLREMVFGKFIAGMILLTIALLLTFPVPVTAVVLGEPDFGAILCGYAGALLLGCAYLSMASFCSAISKSQTASFLLSVFLCGFFLFAGWPRVTELLALWLPQNIVDAISSCSFLSNYQAFQKGLIDSSELVYAVSITLFFLALTWFTLEFAATVPSGLFSAGIIRNRASRRALGRFCLRLVWILLVTVSLIVTGHIWKTRIDISTDQAYSISPVSKEVVAKLESPVLVRFYASRTSKVMLPVLKKYADRVEWLLKEFASASNGNIILEIVDPAENPIYDEAASMDGCTAMTDPSGEQFYLGISASNSAKTQVIPYLTPRHEAQLEYEIIRIVQNVARKQLPALGIMSPLPVFGKQPDLSSQFRQMQNEVVTIDPPWYVISELMKDYQVVQIPMDAPEIPEDIEAVIVIHPSGMQPRTQFALDQFVLRGGKLAVFTDPRSFYAVLKSKKDYSMMDHFVSDLSGLFDTWGASYSKNLFAADMDSAYRNKLPDRIVTNPLVLNLQKNRFRQDSPEAAHLNTASLYFTGFFTILDKPGVKSRVLLETSANTQIVSSEVSSPEMIMRRFKSGEKALPLAVCLEGTFETAFPDGAPDLSALKENTKVLKKSNKESRIYLFSDSDMLFNDVCVQKVMDVTGQQIWARSNDNITLVLNVAEQLTNQRSLAEIRSRIPMSRPLTRFNEIKAKAELRYRDKILKAERDYVVSTKRLELMRRAMRKSPSKELMAEIRTETNKNQEARRELNMLRHSLRTELEQLETRIKVINLVLVPGIIALLGIIYAFARHSFMTKRSKS